MNNVSAKENLILGDITARFKAPPITLIMTEHVGFNNYSYLVKVKLCRNHESETS